MVSNKSMLKVKYTLAIIGFTSVWQSKIFAQHSISSYEYYWAVFHPFAALKIKHRLPIAMNVYKEVESAKLLDTLNSGGKLDAFRHTYTMAFLSRKIGTKKLKKLGRAHEKGNYKQFMHHQLEDGERPDSIAGEMDLRNNIIGCMLGAENNNSTDEELKVIVILAIKAGKAWYLKRDINAQYMTCQNEIINIKEFTGKWFIPKCLIKTDE